MRLEAELHMRALARKQKRDLAAQAAVGTGLAASEHGDSSTEHSVRQIGLGGQERSVMDAPRGNPWDALSGGGDTTYASSRRTGRSTPKPAPRPVAIVRRPALPPGEQDWVLDEANEMAPPRGPPPRALGQPFGRKLVSFEGDGKSMGNSTFSRNPWEHAKKMEAFFTGIPPPRKSLLPPESSVDWETQSHAFGRDHSGLTNEARHAALGNRFADPERGATLTLRRALPLARCSTPALAFRAPPRKDAGAFSRDFLKRTRTGTVEERYHQATHKKMNIRGTGCIVDRDPGISWDMACQAHEDAGALGGPDCFGVVDDGVLPRRPAGAAHVHCAVYGQVFGGPPVDVTMHYDRQTRGFTEEEKRMFMLTGERKRRHSERRMMRTHTIPGLNE